MKDCTKLDKKKKQQKYVVPVAGSKPELPPRVRLDTRILDWDEEDPGAPETKRVVPVRSIPVTAIDQGIVTSVRPGRCKVFAGGTTLNRRSMAGLAVGDTVLFTDAAVQEILPRRTVLSRPDPHNPAIEKVLAANIDVVVNVVSVKSPPLRPGLIDRYLVAIARGGAEPLICVNKVDLVEDPKELDAVDVYRDIGVPVVFCSAATGAGVPELLDALRGRMCVFTGHSGVGKSSLLNACFPGLRLGTGEVSAVSQKGLHTTTASSLHFLPDGTRVVDTPGIRQLGLWEISAADLRESFREFGEYSGACTYADCSHTHEPECGVKGALERGEIRKERFAAYLRILGSL